MFKANSAVQPTEQNNFILDPLALVSRRTIYGVVQVLTFGLSGLVSLARGNKGKSLREMTFGDVSYFEHLKQAKITPPSWAFGRRGW